MKDRVLVENLLKWKGVKNAKIFKRIIQVEDFWRFLMKFPPQWNCISKFVEISWTF